MSSKKRQATVPAAQPLDQLLANLTPPPAHEPQAILGEPEPELPPEPSIHLANVPPEVPTLPGFMMTDDPDELPTPRDPGLDTPTGLPFGHFTPAPPDPLPGHVPAGEAAPPLPSIGAVTARPIDVPTEDFVTGLKTGVRYESRIRVLEAYQYPGNLRGAPEWVDRNWTGYASDYDPLRGLEPGPALRVPTRHGDTVVLCRPGDYVVQQSIVLAHGVEPDIVTEVWAKESFEKNFIPSLTQASERLISEDGLRGSTGQNDQVLEGALSG